MAKAKNWHTIRAQRPLNEQRVAAYKRLMQAELRLSELRNRRGLSQAAIADALSVSQPNISRIEQEDDVYLSTLARYVAALGGHLEVQAVFPDETITVLREQDLVDATAPSTK
ncbi:MAG: helix-turn-helix domain-containing protein [Solirubrobacteraceae bacterium]